MAGSVAVAAGAAGLGASKAQASVPMEMDGSKFKLAAPEANAKRGGVLRYGITMRPPHLDFHQSGTINNLGSQACMYDNLIRYNPNDSGQTIIPDLAHSWEIAKDGKTYTFHLRKGVEFSDGAKLTSADVKATSDCMLLSLGKQDLEMVLPHFDHRTLPPLTLPPSSSFSVLLTSL